MRATVVQRLAGAVLVSLAIAGCSGSDEAVSEGPDWVVAIPTAIDAVEAELGGPQDFFEVTATRQLVNVFVAVDDATAAVPYVFLDGELQPPGPRVDGAAGQTFRSDEVRFDPSLVLSGVEDELPNATIDALSVEGGPGTTVRFVISARSELGGALDVVVTGAGAVVSVDFL